MTILFKGNVVTEKTIVFPSQSDLGMTLILEPNKEDSLKDKVIIGKHRILNPEGSVIEGKKIKGDFFCQFYEVGWRR